jgi:hypothetical protein
MIESAFIFQGLDGAFNFPYEMIQGWKGRGLLSKGKDRETVSLRGLAKGNYLILRD